MGTESEKEEGGEARRRKVRWDEKRRARRGRRGDKGRRGREGPGGETRRRAEQGREGGREGATQTRGEWEKGAWLGITVV